MRRFTLNSIMLPYLFCPINFLTEAAHKTKLVRQHVSGATCPAQMETGRLREPRSLSLSLHVCFRHTALPPWQQDHHQTRALAITDYVWFLNFFSPLRVGDVKSLWSSVLRDTDCGSKKKKKLSGTGFCDTTPQSLDGLTRTTGASRRPWQQTQGCLPSPLASQI